VLPRRRHLRLVGAAPCVDPALRSFVSGLSLLFLCRADLYLTLRLVSTYINCRKRVENAPSMSQIYHPPACTEMAK
jgi:hypothetical protein